MATQKFVIEKSHQEWMRRTLGFIRHQGVWGYPDAGATFKVDQENKVLKLDFVHDRSSDVQENLDRVQLVTESIGWTYEDSLPCFNEKYSTLPPRPQYTMPTTTFVYAGWEYFVADRDPQGRAIQVSPVLGQHHSSSKAKHLRAALEQIRITETT